jgi:hypothetical protein
MLNTVQIFASQATEVGNMEVTGYWDELVAFCIPVEIKVYLLQKNLLSCGSI